MEYLCLYHSHHITSKKCSITETLAPNINMASPSIGNSINFSKNIFVLWSKLTSWFGAFSEEPSVHTATPPVLDKTKHELADKAGRYSCIFTVFALQAEWELWIGGGLELLLLTCLYWQKHCPFGCQACYMGISSAAN